MLIQIHLLLGKILRFKDEQEFKDELTSEILLINAILKVKDLSPSERRTLIKTKRMKIKELNKLGEFELASVLSIKLSKAQAIVNYQGPDNHTYYHTFDDETDEFAIIQDNDQQLKTQIVFAILVLDSKIDRSSTSSADKQHMKTIKSHFIKKLRELVEKELADNLV